MSLQIESFVELEQFIIDDASVRLLNYKWCLQNYCVVLGKVDMQRHDPVSVGMLEPDDKRTVQQIQTIISRPVEPVRLNAYEIRKALDIGYGQYTPDHHKFKLTLRPVGRVSFDPNTSAAEIINELLGRALTLGASDVHIESYEDDVDVRFRIDGMLHQINSPITKDNLSHVVARLKILSDLDIAEKRKSQDGRLFAAFEIDGEARDVDFRLSILPGPFGEDAVMRILDSNKPLIGLDQLGFPDQLLDTFRDMISNPEGMILVTGPTGSGKTTTLYAALQEINSDENKILTVEDPIEYLFRKTNQKQVSTKMSFADYARAFMRQDPDVMLIGEIRDEETADIALRAAQTGHMVLSTLHTNDSVSTVTRLSTLGVPAGLVADTLLGAVSQRLVRRVCERCRQEVEPDEFAIEVFELLDQRFPVYAGAGCDSCLHTGFAGRIGLYELFVIDRQLSDMIGARIPALEIRRLARQNGMRSLFDDALEKVRAGITTFAELRRRVSYRIIHEMLNELK